MKVQYPMADMTPEACMAFLQNLNADGLKAFVRDNRALFAKVGEGDAIYVPAGWVVGVMPNNQSVAAGGKKYICAAGQTKAWSETAQTMKKVCKLNSEQQNHVDDVLDGAALLDAARPPSATAGTGAARPSNATAGTGAARPANATAAIGAARSSNASAATASKR